MSNVMSMKQLRNHVSRNAFDLSLRKCFTAKVGELLPVFFKEVLPGDKFSLGLQSFTRTQPVNSAAYTRIKEYYDYFFVPYRLLWRYSDQFFTDTMGSNAQFAQSIDQKSFSSPNRSPYFIASDLIGYLNSKTNFTKYADGKSGYNHACFNEFGYYRQSLSYKLLRYLGYGLINDNSGTSIPGSFGFLSISNQGTGLSSSNVVLNAFPLLAYQKIYQDYFRNQQWEKSSPSTYNVDYLSSSNTKVPVTILANCLESDNLSSNMFDLRYCTWNKDLFTGVLPSPQFGDTAYIQHDNEQVASFDNGEVSGNFALSNFSLLASSNSNSSGLVVDGSQVRGTGSSSLSTSNFSGTLHLTNDQLSSFSVLALRQAEALQKWKEISISGKQDYKEQIEKHFGVKVPAVRSNLCDWLGGTSSNMDISEVVNTNLQGMNTSGSTVQSNIAGKGVGVMQGHESFEAKEHGIIMCIYHAVPLLDYSDDITDPYLLKGSKFDYAIPEFDSIGMQSLPGLCLSSVFGGSVCSSDNVGDLYGTVDKYNSLGYVPRYADYKTSVDVVTGEFSRSLKYWAAPLSNDYFKKFASLVSTGKKLNSSFFKVNPSVLDTIFLRNADSFMSSDNLLVNSFHDIKAVRNLDYNGLPY